MTSDTWKQIGPMVLNGIVVILVIAGGLWLLDAWSADKQKELDNKLKNVCSVITQEQPSNIDLYDNCMDRGYEMFAPDTVDDRSYNGY